VLLDLSRVIYVSDPYNNRVVEYSPGATGSATVAATISGSSTCLSRPSGLALDAAARLYVANSYGCNTGGGAGTVVVFPAASTGNATPTSTISVTGWSPSSLALDASGNLYVSAGNPGYKIAPGANGVVLPLASYPNGYGSCPGPIAVTSAGTVAIGCQGIGFVLYPAASTGTVSSSGLFTAYGPTATVNAATIDQQGNLVIAASQTNYGTYIAPADVETFAASLGTSASPIATLTGANTQMLSIFGVGYDKNGYLYVLNSLDQQVCSILAFAPNAAGNSSPVATIPSICGSGLAVQ
jgi:hypothetical protein